MQKQTATTALMIATFALATLGTVRNAEAAACCMSATSGGVGRLLIWEKAAVGLRISPTVGMGFWSPDQTYFPYDGYRETEWRSTAWGIARLHRRVSASATLPLVWNVRSAGAIEDRAVGVGDASVGVRYEAVAIGELLGVPAIAISASLTAPTGRSADAADGDLAADATGRGAWVPSVNVALETLREPLFVRLDVGGAIPIAFERQDNGARVRYGESLSLGLTGGVEVTERLVVDLSLRAMLEARVVQDGERLPDTSRVDLGIGPGVSWRALDHWTFTLGADTGVFADGLGRNQQGRISATLGVRYGIF